MGEKCSTYRATENTHTTSEYKARLKKDHWEDVDIDGRMILK